VPYRESLVRYPCYVQTKLDGFRAYYVDGHLHSRNGHRWHESIFAHITGRLREVVPPGVVLDGELYRHGWAFERIAEALSLFRSAPVEDIFEVGFYVFDSPSGECFGERVEVCRRLVKRLGHSHVQIVPCESVGCRESADELHERHLGCGFEGTIYRRGGCGYVFGRSERLLKRKEKEKRAECAARFRD
jgi:ATP-dependent DNA ligase